MMQPAPALPPGFDKAQKRAVVMLTSPGRRVALINTLRSVAGSLDLDLRILACDPAPRGCPACLLADAAYQTPHPQDPNYIDALLEICVIHCVTLILPTEAAELAPLSRNRDRFERIGATIAISSPEMVELTLAPKDTEAVLCAHGFRGYCAGSDTSIAWAAESLWSRKTSDQSRKEVGSRRFEVLMYFDRKNRLRATIPCERIMESGIEVLVTRRCPAITATADRLSRHFPGLGPIVSLDATLRPDGSVIVDGIKASLGEGFEVAHRAGAEIVKWLLREHSFGSAGITDEWQDGVGMIRYQAAMFVLPN